jgi:hypothetical protein
LVKGEPNKTALRPLNWGPKGIFQGTQFGPLTDGGLVTHLKQAAVPLRIPPLCLTFR